MANARRLEPGDDAYPAALRDVRPPCGPLWVAGVIPERCVAVVGSRTPDLGGLQAARALGRGLVAAGLTVVSGGAIGCDAAAHEGALAAGGRTVVVLGSGLRRPYPRENVELFRRVVEAGALVSPFELDVEALPGHFHRRNRIIAALGAATVVVRAGERSGALSTAAHALRLGRPVLVVPGSTTCACAVGSNDLLRRGCGVVLEAADVVRALAGGPAAARAAGAGHVLRTERASGALRASVAQRGPRRAMAGVAGEDVLLALISGGEPAGADELAAASGLPAGDVAARLGWLEIEGLVARLADGRFRVAVQGG